MSTDKTEKNAASEPQTELPGVEVRRFHPTSLANVIAALEVGESESRAMRIEFDKAKREDVNAAIANMRRTLSKAADRAGERSGRTFTTETGAFLTRSGDLMLVAVVTRLA